MSMEGDFWWHSPKLLRQLHENYQTQKHLWAVLFLYFLYVRRHICLLVIITVHTTISFWQLLPTTACNHKTHVFRHGGEFQTECDKTYNITWTNFIGFCCYCHQSKRSSKHQLCKCWHNCMIQFKNWLIFQLNSLQNPDVSEVLLTYKKPNGKIYALVLMTDNSVVEIQFNASGTG